MGCLGALRARSRGTTIEAGTKGNLVLLVPLNKGPALYQIPAPLTPSHSTTPCWTCTDHLPSVHSKSPLLSASIPILFPLQTIHPTLRISILSRLRLNSGSQASHPANVGCLDPRHPLNVHPSFSPLHFPHVPLLGIHPLLFYAHYHCRLLPNRLRTRRLPPPFSHLPVWIN